MKTKRSPKELLLTLLAAAVCLALYKLFGIKIFGLFDNTYIGYFAAQFFFAVLAVAAAVLLKRTDALRADRSGLKGGWASAALLIVMILFYFVLGLSQLLEATALWWEVLFVLAYVFLIGFCEELLFRGLIQGSMHRYFGEESGKAVVLAIVLSGFLFGASHIANLTEPGATLRGVLYQVCNVAFSGVYYGAIYYRCRKNIWYCAVLHGLYDLTALIIDGILGGEPVTAAPDLPAGSELTGLLLWFVIYAVATVIILRPKKLRPLLAEKA